MKTPLFFLGICAGLSASAQTIEISDTLSTGDAMMYYVVDSTADNYASTTGTGVTWDYSAIGGYGLPANTNNVIDRSASAFSSDFPAADYSEDFENGVISFLSHEPGSNRSIVHGFVFEELSNTFIIQYNDDQLISFMYPMNQGDSYMDDIEGTAVVPLGAPIDISGTATVTADGLGTLIIGANTYTDILRVRTLEETSGIAMVGGEVNFTRESYAYYESGSNFPIFIHGRILAEAGLLGDFGFSAVYSRDEITEFAGVEEEVELLTLSVYPNPVIGNSATVTSIEGTQSLTILNSLGQTIATINNPKTIEEIDLSDLNTGVYFVQAIKGNATRTEKFIVK